MSGKRVFCVFTKLLATLKLLENNPHIFSTKDIPMLVSRELDLRK